MEVYHDNTKQNKTMYIVSNYALTLSQWQFSGNPVAIQCAKNLDPSVYWNATGEIIFGSQCFSGVLPVLMWSYNGLPVCSNYAN